MHKVRLLWLVIKRSGAGKLLNVFVILYLLCALVVMLVEPNVTSYWDALWFLWAVSLTVGLGDYTAVTILGRVATMICSLFALVIASIVTAVIVDFFNESRQHQMNEALTTILDKLERLPELSKEELEHISNQIKKYR